jgi:polar amino acid transport system permease protein
MTVASDPAEGGAFRSAQGVRKVPLRHPWWWVGGVVLLLLIAMFTHLLVTNENMRWSVVLEYLFDAEILGGLVTTLELTVLAMVFGLALGILLAMMRLSANPLFRSVSWLWLWFFRGVPPLVQMVFWFNLATLVPELKLGIPFGPVLKSWDTNTVISSFSAAILGLALTESAYAAEMIRAGIQAVSKGQTEAALVIGMSKSQVMRRIVLPQALRIVIPPIGNDLISMLKFTSLVSVLATPDLLYSAQMIYSRNYKTIPLLLVATIWYLVLTTLLTVAQQHFEKRLTLTRATAGPAGNTRRLRFLPSFGKA